MARKAVKMTQTEFEDLLISWSRKHYTLSQSGYASLEQEAEHEAKFSRLELIERRLNRVFGWCNDESNPVIKDLSKVQFDFENFGCDLAEDDPCGFWMTTTSVPMLGCYAGGDWEDPVFFVLYPESSTKVRAYMPKEGNTWNIKTKTAWGSGDEEDEDPDENPRKVDVAAFRADVEARIQAK